MATLEQVRRDALSLSSEERELLALDLALSFEKEPGYEEAWDAEIRRRFKEIDDGTAELLEWDEAKKLIFEPCD
jgi:putative addiction module component (TIGR02574 family)